MQRPGILQLHVVQKEQDYIFQNCQKSYISVALKFSLVRAELADAYKGEKEAAVTSPARVSIQRTDPEKEPPEY